MTAPGGCLLDQADLACLTLASGISLQSYRQAHVSACVGRALARHGIRTSADLARKYRRDPAARAALRRSILVPVTGLFRDPEQFELLDQHVLPALLRSRPGISVWSAGCSDGSELYSVALLLRRRGLLARCRLLGSDVLDERVELARRGEVVAEAVRSDARPVLRWERRDLLRRPPPAGAFDLILCRNVAIYFERATQRDLHARLAGALSRGGMLLLGRSERLLCPERYGLIQAGPHLYRNDTR
ncbi:MAG: CheR family methyltransferase [Streptosporangiaceae bacterium]